jgi:hypothetical protein
MNAAGVILKVHYPEALRLVRGSARLFIGYDETSTPIRSSGEKIVDSDRYIAFFLFPEDVDNGDRQTVQFNLKAVAPDPSAFIEIDLDNNDRNTPDKQEFSEEDPQFTNIDRWNVTIAGTPMATPVPEGTAGSETPSATPAATTTPGS